MSEVPKQKTIGAVETTFDVLDVLSEREPIGVSEIAGQLDTSTSTVFTHLNTLIQEGYVVKTGTAYQRSLRFLENGGVIRQRYQSLNLLTEKVDELAATTGEIVGAAVEERGYRIILYRSAGEMAAADKIPIGDHTYMHWTSLGKAILAHLSAPKCTTIIDQHRLPRGTGKTITDCDELEKELERIHQQGYAIDDEEHLQGVRGVAVPILDNDQKALASIGITGPRNRFTPSYIGELLNSLKYAKNEIEVRGQSYK